MSKINIYIGITCLPKRDNNFDKCLESFKSQDMRPKKVFISYCKNYIRFPELNFNIELIEKYKNDDLFEFIESPVDYGPATKFIAPWSKIKEIEKDNLENTYLIVADDDRTYRSYFIKLFNDQINTKKDWAWTGHSEILSKNSNPWFFLPFGADGYSIKCTWMDKLINWYNKIINIKPEGTHIFYHDDYIYGCFLHYNSIQVRDTQKSSCHHNYVDDVSLTARMKKMGDNRGSSRNQRCFGAYQKLKKMLENTKEDNEVKI